MLGQRATMHVAQPWACREVAAGLGVRQFEFNPHAQADRFVACGTVRGHANPTSAVLVEVGSRAYAATVTPDTKATPLETLASLLLAPFGEHEKRRRK